MQHRDEPRHQLLDDEELNVSCRTTGSSGCDVDDLTGLDSSSEDLEASSLSSHRHSATGLFLPQPRKLFEQNMDFSDDELPVASGSGHLPSDKTPSSTALTGPMGIKASHREGTQPRASSMACSPPYKRVRALRLFDSPATPKTLIEKSAMHTPIPNKCSRLFHPDKPKAVPTCYHNKSDKPSANINPFTPNGMLLTARKRSRSKRSLIGSPELRIPKFDLVDSEESDNDLEQPTKRVALQESNISRYYQEFLELELLGSGEFGSVYKCTHRLDGCNYAVKKSIKPVAGSASEKNALNEVYAHAVLGKHQHVVRYYSAWAEDNHMIIQNEYCNGGSLADAISKMRQEKRHYSEAELRQLLLHVAEGLRYIHSMQLVHMDIKPGNIFISREKSQLRVNYDSADDGFDEEETEEEITYKIGDLGHVTSINNPQVEEGDCRYLPTEILHEDFMHLTKADIFALGLTMYEAGGGGPLPKNGPEWHDIRNGNLAELPQYSRDFNELLKLMIHPNPEMRPSAVSLIQHRVLSPNGNKTKAQLRRELNAERLKSNAERIKNEILSKQLQEAVKCLKTLAPNMVALNNGQLAANAPASNGGYKLRPLTTRTSSRAIGKTANRSSSTTNF
ncbi:wee1-like protein kinase 1-A isoform X1 [Nasonia vitripennis]|uniref:Wee1-like protein kinase n=2 Tax=Nasonia vitripennis TaxID=7425 RepID=A0A7M7J248_NASVI|nr:wee1-like protein kinase 1-A isoform X1 [Nasonia vitripennis]